MKKIIITCISVIVLANLFFYGCEDIIDFERDNEGGNTVIFGRVADLLEDNQVSVSLTAPFDRPPIPISFSEVYIYDSDGNSEQFFETVKEGVYKPRNLVLDRSDGEQFRLEVCMPNGEMYRSEIQIMPAKAGIDSVYFEVNTRTELTARAIEIDVTTIDVFLNSKIARDGENSIYLRWEVDEVYSFQEAQLPTNKFPLSRWNTCYITNPVDAQKFFLFNGTELQSDRIDNLLLAERPLDGSFDANHYFNVYKYSMNFETFDYWRKVSQLTNRVGSIFDSPPAAIPSNIVNIEDSEEVVFGYFESVRREVSRLLVTKNDIPVDFERSCTLPEDFSSIPFNCFSCLPEFLDEECLNCLLLKNSSGIRPDYF